jgi:hypothetical protein
MRARIKDRLQKRRSAKQKQEGDEQKNKHRVTPQFLIANQTARRVH